MFWTATLAARAFHSGMVTARDVNFILYLYLFVLVTGSGVAVGRNQVTCIHVYGHETIGCFVE